MEIGGGYIILLLGDRCKGEQNRVFNPVFKIGSETWFFGAGKTRSLFDPGTKNRVFNLNRIGYQIFGFEIKFYQLHEFVLYNKIT